MPRKELVILLGALAIEISRMFLVDLFVMQEYFGGRAYKIFREPMPCSSNAMRSWQGADSQWYCDDVTLHVSDTKYYVAAHQQAWSMEPNVCSTFTTASSLLNFDERAPQGFRGHTRFKTMGWVIGGEFALYYFFATFVNEVADNMFVIPTTTRGGWLCKIFSIALEVFQLGALCPAAIFMHKDCLFFTDPLGISLHTISTVVIIFGYCIWSFALLSLPLAAIGAAMLGSLFLIGSAASALAPCLRTLGYCQCFNSFPSAKANLDHVADRLGNLKAEMQAWFNFAKLHAGRGIDAIKNMTMVLAFLPMLMGGMFLGTLVVVGQGSKQGTMQVLTAIVLLSDVLFKVIATLITEFADFMLHHRVRRIVRSGTNRGVEGQTIGQPRGARGSMQL